MMKEPWQTNRYIQIFISDKNRGTSEKEIYTDILKKMYSSTHRESDGGIFDSQTDTCTATDFPVAHSMHKTEN